MAAPLLLFALADLVRHKSKTKEEEEDDSNDDEVSRELGDGDDDDEEYRKTLRKQLDALRLSRRSTREGPEASGSGTRRPSGLRRDQSSPDVIIDPARKESEKCDTESGSRNEDGSTEKHETRERPPSRPSSTLSNKSRAARFRQAWPKISRRLFGAKEGTEAGPQEGDPDYVPPKYRWTPIFSGIVQPFSILLEIPSLTEHWYVKQVDGVPFYYQENPVLLDVGLALSMACGVVANIALISRFLERRVFPSTIVCIVMLSIHDIINIAALIAFGVIHGVDDGFDYSEAFWMCVCSTTASFFTNITLVYDLIRTKQFRYSGSGLTPKQRKLVIVVMVLLTYIALGALIFNFLLPEIAFQNSLYYTVVSIETIGFGDISPSTTGARVFLIFYVPIGILNLALAVGTARDTLVESWSGAYRRRRHDIVKRQRERKQQRAEEAAQLAAGNGNEGSSGPTSDENSRKSESTGDQLIASPPKDLATAHVDDLEVSHSKIAKAEIEDLINPSGTHHDSSEAARLQLREELVELSLENEEGYRSFQERMKHEERMENIWKFGSAGGLFVVFWLVGAGIFTRTEESFDFFTALYFCFVTFTTIGYGDVTPTSPAGRAVFIIWAICGVGIVTLLIAVITEAYSNRYKNAVGKYGKDRAKRKPHEEAAAKDRGSLTREEVEKLPYEILGLLKDWRVHLHVARLSAVEGPGSKEAQSLIDDFLAARRLAEPVEKATLADPAGRRVLFWNSYEDGVHRLVNLAEQAIHHIEETRQIERLKSDAEPQSLEKAVDDSKANVEGGEEKEGKPSSISSGDEPEESELNQRRTSL